MGSLALKINSFVLQILSRYMIKGPRVHKKILRAQNLLLQGQGSEKIDLSPSESWDLVQNDQHKLHFTLDIAVSVRNCAKSKN